MNIEAISTIFTFGIVFVYLALPLIYALLAKTWHRTQTGRAVMWLLAALALTVLYVAAGVLWGPHPGRVAFRFATYFVLFTAGVRFAVYMFQTQFQAVRER